MGRDRTGYCWFPLCANRISDLKPPVSENRLFPVCSLSLAMNKRDRNGNSSPVATVLRDGQTVSTTAYQWAVAVLSPELSVQEHWCAAPMCRAACTLPRIWSQWVFDVPQQPPYMSMCRCCRASPPMYSSSIAGWPASNCPACKANLSSSRRWVAGNALSRTTCPAGSPA